jgi:hypothetical protein
MRNQVEHGILGFALLIGRILGVGYQEPARPANRRLHVADRALVGIESRPQPGGVRQRGEIRILVGVGAERNIAAGIANRFQLREAEPALVKQGKLVLIQSGERSSCVGRAAAHPRIFLRKTKRRERQGGNYRET